MTDVSVVFCSRGRPASLKKTVTDLLHKAHDMASVEVIVAVDPDDLATAGAADEAGAMCWTAPERYGYTGLHHYLNHLATLASGAWLMWWNDDMVMQTWNWDQVIRDHPRRAVLWPQANHMQSGSICPIWPKAWSDAWGRVTPTTHMDTYLQYVGEALGRHDKIPVEIIHDRADVTGGHDDVTYAEGRKLLGPVGMAPEFDLEAVRKHVVADVLTLEREGLL